MPGGTLPSINALRSQYPAVDVKAIKDLVGGRVKKSDLIDDVCCVRVSRALNYSGDPIPPRTKKIATVKGSDGKNYAIRTIEFLKYFLDVYGDPSLVVDACESDICDYIQPSRFKGRRGAIHFVVDVFDGADGHVDLWDGEMCLWNGYWHKSEKVYFWECPA